MDVSEALRTFGTGENYHAQHYFGFHKENRDGKDGYVFRVWAPNAQAVHLIGDFTQWRDNPLAMKRNVAGVWEVFTDQPKPNQLYKYLVKRSTGHEVEKIDPFAFYFEQRPGTAAVITDFPEKKWKDSLWLARRKRFGFQKRPVNIYEVHAGSWKKHADGRPYQFKELTEELVPYLVEMNYTHVELMPLMAHPLDASWGYQLMGYFAFESSYGTPVDFQNFVEACHINNIGVIVDWVPGHFTINDDALAYYDGTPTFEYQDYDQAHNRGWGALNFDLGKNQVQSFLISSAKFWIDYYHLDGIRVDAVSNMIHRDYDIGPWTPNKDGGNRNYEGYHFLQKLNTVIKEAYPDVMMIAEESTSGTKVTGPCRAVRFHAAEANVDISSGQWNSHAGGCVVPRRLEEPAQGSADDFRRRNPLPRFGLPQYDKPPAKLGPAFPGSQGCGSAVRGAFSARYRNSRRMD